ncbi:MAG: DUF1844 domain-containing protein [Planctomycetia bacterium]
MHDTHDDAGEPDGEVAGHAPPATFEFLAHTLFTQAVMALGRIPNPITKQAHRNLPTARHFIETLAMLEQKTAGNLTEDERRMLEEIQHQLRMMYMHEQGGAGRAVDAGGAAS